MNQIISSAMKSIIAASVFMQIPMAFRYLFVQYPEIFCDVDFFTRCQFHQRFTRTFFI